jgi:hypothetical protein
VETTLEENVLRYKLPLKDRISLEWRWGDEPNRGDKECTILAHIDVGCEVISIQNKRHLHWRMMESIIEMNNAVEFTASAHSLFLKTDTIKRA